MSNVNIIDNEDQDSISEYKYKCDACQYFTIHRSNYVKHMETNKHLKRTCTKIKKGDLCCVICNFITQKQSNYDIHLNTKKHIANAQKKLDKKNKIKNKNKLNAKPVTKSHDPVITNIFTNIMKDNNEFKQMLIEHQKQMIGQHAELKNSVIELGKKENTVNITNNNNRFNLNVFLNEKCKDAISIKDFIDSIQIDFEDLEYVGRNGFVSGISKIIMKELLSMDLYKRPIHCTDVKREVIHIKDQEHWVKDNEENTKTKKCIESIARKNLLTVSDWQKANPNYAVLDSEEYNLWLKIVRNSNNGGPNGNKNEENVLKKLAKFVAIKNDVMIDEEKKDDESPVTFPLIIENE